MNLYNSPQQNIVLYNHTFQIHAQIKTHSDARNFNDNDNDDDDDGDDGDGDDDDDDDIIKSLVETIKY